MREIKTKQNAFKISRNIKTYAIIACMMLFTGFSNSYAQDDDDDSDYDQRQNLGLGIRAGVNLANIYDTEAEDLEHSTRLGLAVGAFLNIPFGKYIGFQPEIVYSQKGFKSSGSILTADYEYTRRTDYIDIPLQLQIKPINYITLLLGPQYSFLLSKNLKINSGSLGADIENEIDDQDIRKNILGLTFGADVNIENLIISGRVAWDMQRNDGEGTSTSPRYRNVIAQFTLGIYF